MIKNVLFLLMMQKSKKISIIDIYYRHYYHCYCILYIFLYCQYHYYIDWKIIIELSWSQRAIYSYKCWRKNWLLRGLTTASVFHWSPDLRSLTAAPWNFSHRQLQTTTSHDFQARLQSYGAVHTEVTKTNTSSVWCPSVSHRRANKQTNKHCVL